MNVRTLAEADEDLLAAARRLEAGRAGYGALLFVEYRAALENVERFPQIYPLVEDSVPGREFRNVVLTRLNYRIVYEVRDSEVLVVAVLYTGRQPDLWHARITDD